MLSRFFSWFDGIPTWAKILIEVLPIAMVFYFAALLSASVSNLYQPLKENALLGHFLMYSLVAIPVLFLRRIFQFYFDKHRDVISIQREAINFAISLADRTMVRQHENVRAVSKDFENRISDLLSNPKLIQDIVNDVYLTFESIYGKATNVLDRVDFEVTFMTKSYSDKMITIPCSANRQGSKPRSMVLREKDTTIYDNTETARMYKSPRPDPIIVPDTAPSTYSEIYPGQKQRIRSSIIYPVLSDNNELLGTLVVHCDKPGFFEMRLGKYWFDLLEVFAKRISLEKMKIDILNQKTANGPVQVTIPKICPF